MREKKRRIIGTIFSSVNSRYLISFLFFPTGTKASLGWLWVTSLEIVSLLNYKVNCNQSRSVYLKVYDQPGKAVMVDGWDAFSLQLHDGEEDDLQERNQLTIDQPDINQPDVGCWGQLRHHTEKNRIKITAVLKISNSNHKYLCTGYKFWIKWQIFQYDLYKQLRDFSWRGKQCLNLSCVIQFDYWKNYSELFEYSNYLFQHW